MTKRITVIIQDMECPNCAMRLESIEDKLEGVLLAEARCRSMKLKSRRKSSAWGIKCLRSSHPLDDSTG